MENRILQGEWIDLENDQDRVLLKKGRNSKFVLRLNGRVVRLGNTWPPIQKKLDEIGNLIEVED